MLVLKNFALGFVLLLAASMSASANEFEIKHLMKFIAQSQCMYVRNGKKHTAKDALEHIKKKYEYYSDDIETTEDFIRLSASKSSMSGKPYTVECKGQATITSEEWLTKELIRMRQPA
ncbi:MAG: DUF5329 domain-containing protein [Gammaproteobacteria bacterium]|nr:DUF5329 domain-containing protein [Gammaproteobacteria bacterium]